VILGIGAQKSGTTALYQWLIRHPEVTRGSKKEHHYLDRTYPLITSEDYLAATKGIDITPAYMFTQSAPARARSIMPDAKVFAVLRNPVERAWSSYRAMIKRHSQGTINYPDYDKPPVQALKDTGRGYLMAGKYFQHLTNWHTHFKVYVCRYEDLFFEDEPYLVLQKYLGLTPTDTERTSHHVGMEMDMPNDVRDFLTTFYHHQNQHLYDLTGVRW